MSFDLNLSFVGRITFKFNPALSHEFALFSSSSFFWKTFPQTESRNLAQFNVDNKYGRDALRIVLEKIFEVDYLSRFGRDTDADEERHEKFVQLNDALKGVSIEGPIAEVTIAKFLNRILGLPVHLQNYLFDYFMETLDSTIDKAKREGKYDLGIMGMCSLFVFFIIISILFLFRQFCLSNIYI